MDLGIVLGLLGTWVLIVWAILSSGDMVWFINWPSVILVVGGSTTVLIMASPVKTLMRIGAMLRRAIFHQQESIEKLIEDIVHYAEIARRDGILSLENTTKDIKDPFIVSGIQMAVDGTDPELIEQIMTTELDNLIERHGLGKGMLETLGKYAPAFGMVGTLIGLVVMLQNMSDPSKIGPGMAVALLTTLYGSLMANGIFLPLADRLGRRSEEEVLIKTIIIRGVMAIQSGDNPRIVEQKLRTFLPPAARREREAARNEAA